MIKEPKEQKEKLTPREILRLVIVGLILLIVIVIVIGIATSKEGEFVVNNVRSDYVNFEALSELRSAEYIYNGVETKKDSMGNVEYYVKYEGTVKVGFDPKKIKTNIDDKNHKITITLPRMEILEVYVDETKIDYIKKKWTLDDEKLHPDAYNYATERIKERAKTNANLHREAIKNAKSIITAAYEPFITVNGVKYDIVFTTEDEYKGVE